MRVCLCILPLFHFPSSRLHFTSPGTTKVQTGQKNEISPSLPTPPPLSSKRRRAARREEASKRSHRPRRVVAGIPAADFICRMSTSRGHVRSRAEPRGEGRMRGTSEKGTRVRGGKRTEIGLWWLVVETVRRALRGHGTRIGPSALGQHQTAINSVLDLSCLTAAIGALADPITPARTGFDHFSWGTRRAAPRREHRLVYLPRHVRPCCRSFRRFCQAIVFRVTICFFFLRAGGRGERRGSCRESMKRRNDIFE